jgi:hypothetical protein
MQPACNRLIKTISRIWSFLVFFIHVLTDMIALSSANVIPGKNNSLLTRLKLQHGDPRIFAV